MDVFQLVEAELNEITLKRWTTVFSYLYSVTWVMKCSNQFPVDFIRFLF